MTRYQIYWRGRIPVGNVSWQFSHEREQFLSDSLEKKRDEIWKKTIESHPETYDGKVLTLDDFRATEDSISMDLGFIRFLRVLTLDQAKQRPEGYGTLGVQAIIFSPDKQHILVGERSAESMYCPLFHAVPGGILEVGDTNADFENACLREISEEVSVKLRLEKELVAMLSQLHGTVGIAMIIVGTVVDDIDMNERVLGNEEWSNNRLSWYSVDSLGQFSHENSLEGLLFVKDEWEIHQKSKTSVLW